MDKNTDGNQTVLFNIQHYQGVLADKYFYFYVDYNHGIIFDRHFLKMFEGFATYISLVIFFAKAAFMYLPYHSNIFYLMLVNQIKSFNETKEVVIKAESIFVLIWDFLNKGVYTKDKTFDHEIVGMIKEFNLKW